MPPKRAAKKPAAGTPAKKAKAAAAPASGARKSKRGSESETKEVDTAKEHPAAAPETPSKKASTKKVSSTKKTSAKKASEKKADKKTSAKTSTKKTSAKKSPAKKAKSDEKKDTSVQAPPKATMEQLHADLKPKLEAYRKARAFNAKKWITEKCKMFNKYMADCKLSGCVVSLSGGVDSAVTLGLMVTAAKAKGSPIKKVAAVAQPIKSSAWALNRARECAKDFDVDLFVVDQTDLHSQLTNIVDKEVGIVGAAFASGQLRSYMRTPVGYYVAQLISQAGNPCVVMGTGNMDEDGYLAYFCKAGDGVVDIQLIADLHKSEVFAVGKELGVPDSILVAAPSADLWDGHTDEEELGFTYDFVELYTGHYLKLSPAEQKKFVDGLSAGAKDQFAKWSAACTAVHNRNKHKFGGPKNLNVL